MAILTLVMLTRFTPGDDRIALPVLDQDHALKVVAAYGLENLDDVYLDDEGSHNENGYVVLERNEIAELLGKKEG